MEWTVLSQRINQIYWLLSLDLTRNLSDNCLNLEHDLENLNIGATSPGVSYGKARPESTAYMTLSIISSNCLPCIQDLVVVR